MKWICPIKRWSSSVQQARIALCLGVRDVIRNALTMFKINVPESM